VYNSKYKSEKKRKHFKKKKKNIPIRKRKIFQLEKYSSEKKENIPIRKEIFPISKRKIARG
jgi:hypothetical protein